MKPFIAFPERRPFLKLATFKTLSLAMAFLAITLSTPAAGNSASPNHKIQVYDPALAAQLIARGATLIADYGSYQLLAVREVEPALASHPAAESRDDYHVIYLNAAALDTRLPETKALSKPVGDFIGKRMHLVHFSGPVQPAWHDELLATGVRIIDYIPENAYLVYGDAASIARVQTLAAGAPHIQWEGSYRDEYRIHPNARAMDANGNPREIGTDEFMVQLVADADANTNTVQLLEALKLAPIKRQHDILHYLNVQVSLAPSDLAIVAAQPDVISIQPYFKPQKYDERQGQIIAGNITGNVPTAPGYLSWLTSKGFTQAQFTASGFAVDVSDSGIDDGTTTPNHFGLYVNGDLGNTSRVLYNRLEGTPHSGSTLKGCDGHGTLNTHIIGGYDDLKNFPFVDSSGYHYGLGICPFVNVGSSVIFDPETFTSPNYSTLQSAAYGSGARISNNSWGANSAGAYNTDSQSYDILVRDAQSSVSGNQEMVIVFAAGNAGSAAQTVGSPGTAKNVITVGAGEGVQAIGGTDASGIGDGGADSCNDMATFSSVGPCSDGRHKPELSAPGTHISGGVVQSNMPASTGTADSCYTGSGVSGGAGSIFFPPGQQFYTASDGTSHATPCVSGGCALVRQYFINNFTNPPSPAMTKAFLVNSTRYMTGLLANDSLWSNEQGFGEMNLGMAFDGTARIVRDEVPADLFTASGQTRTFTGFISDTNKPFRVTVSWTDAPGSTAGNAYNNNLDLTVTAGGNTYKGNVFSGSFSATGGSADAKDNTECVFLPAGVSGNFVVTINATSINSIGVPNAGNVIEQDFALVIYNGVSQNVPILQSAGMVLTAESCQPTNGFVDPGETVTLNLSLQNIGTANTTNLVATLQSNAGVTPLSGAQTYGALTTGGGSISQPFTFTAAGNCGGTITATLQLQDGTANLGTVNFNITLGTSVRTNILAQNFDGVTAPALPSGWTSAVSGFQPNWVTSATTSDTAPNAAFAACQNNIGVSELSSPTIHVNTATAQLTFRNNYNFQHTGSTGDDGGVLEIKIGSGSFTDIIAAGGAFVSGGYNETISTAHGSGIAGRQAWSNTSGGFITTTVNLPAAAAGQNVVLKWRCAADNGVSSTGWFIDSIALQDTVFLCCGPNADLAITQSVTPPPQLVGQNVTYTYTVTNSGPLSVSDASVTNTLPANAAFVSASSGGVLVGNKVFYTLNSVPVGGSTNFTLTVTPTAIGTITNTAVVGSSTLLDLNLANNTSALVITAVAPPTIVTSPTNESVIAGTNPLLLVSASGTTPFSYQWSFNGTNISGATQSLLQLSNVDPTFDGTYSVIVTNAYGSTTGAIANLTVLVPPAIANPPVSVKANIGTNVSFTVGASGDVPLGYQWLFNGTNIANATSTLLSLLNVQAAQAGAYSVLVTNDAGGVTSAPAQLTVLVPPIITSINVTSNDVAISFSSLSNCNYLLQFKNTLLDTNWTSITPATAGTGGVLTLHDTFTNSQPTRFYRVNGD